MRLLGGIDEAGLGPLLGPLALGSCGLRTELAPAELWPALSEVVSGDASADRTHLIVADSKRVFTRDARGHARLERTVLAFWSALAEGGEAIHSANGFLRMAFGTRNSTFDFDETYPWYNAGSTALPLWNTGKDIAECGARLQNALQVAGVELVHYAARLVAEGELNLSFARSHSKGATLWEQAALRIEELWELAGEEELELWLDRQGGRTYYADLLQGLYPFAPCQTLLESSERSEYRLSQPGPSGSLRLIVTPKAEDASFAVALASCAAKYARELAMHTFNHYWTERAPTLRPTAGYVSDARRWLADASPVLSRFGIQPKRLLRER